MRQKYALRLLSGAAFGAFLLVSSLPQPVLAQDKPAQQDAPVLPDAPAKPNPPVIEDPAAQAMPGTEDDPVTEETVFTPDGVNTFSGAFLAARTADVDHDYATAIALYEKALGFEPANVDIRERLMISLLMNGEFDRSLTQVEALKEDNAVERITTIVRGLDLIRKGDYAAAEKVLVYKGNNDLDRLTHVLMTAWAKVGAGKGSEAIRSIRNLKGPDWFKAFTEYHLGAMALVAGDNATARRSLTAAITNEEGMATTPDTFMRAVMALARLEAKEGNKRKALDAIAVAERQITNYAPLKALRDSIEKGETPDQQITTATQGAASVLFSIGSALNRQGAEEMVSLYLQISHALDPTSADTLILLGGIAEKLEMPKQAIELYGRVPADSPMRRISELQLGLTLAQTGDVAAAREHLKTLIETDPSDIRSYIAYGSVLSDAKDYAEMAKTYDRAVEAIGPVPRPTDWSVFFQRGIAYERLKEWDKAEPNFRKALELNPDQPQVLNYLGYSWVDMNRNLDEGLEMIRKAVELRPDDGYIVDSLGWAYYRLGRYAEAVEELERAAQLRAGDATINDHLGDAYWRVGRRLEAGFQWQRALSMKPELTEIPKIEQKLRDGLAEAPTPPVSTAMAGAGAGAGASAGAGAGASAGAGQAAPDAATAKGADKPAAAADLLDYTVNGGDTLWKIAHDQLGDGDRAPEIIELNPDLKRNPNRLQPGQILKLPPARR
ncbi:tetratricopeptide repeat protein [Rhizobium sp. SSA_523]|uniref:tetratricopeptide repeat protein n=1 Tax=Rhizobium sp. SSA_523 TaxID=2952477 RepID=UPI002090C113|nr:tetratricopeptide repeat protein [Rhizobium sp. SSA_523]MCO5731112.1 tetratricopeptide repeat protein [Rhizobium sp. SSA_523]WKC24091.1 tetratricopeptide repeat protein [Rhizobium sp. SSA_523]